MKASVTISRRSDDTIAITIKDEVSRERVCEVKLSLEDFAKALTGQGELSGDVRYGELAVVGKRKVKEPRNVTVAKPVYGFADKDWAKSVLLKACQEEGWSVDYHLGAQNSIVFNQYGDTYTINYSVYKYVDIEE
jgi:hypothetical protein